MTSIFDVVGNVYTKTRHYYMSTRKRYYLQFNNSTEIHDYTTSISKGIELINNSKFLRKSCAVYSIDGNGDVTLEYANAKNVGVRKVIRKHIKDSKHERL